jgi:hypothetical protein
MGNKNTEAQKRRRKNKRLRESQIVSKERIAYADDPTSNELDHEYGMEEQDFADFCENGDH